MQHHLTIRHTLAALAATALLAVPAVQADGYAEDEREYQGETSQAYREIGFDRNERYVDSLEFDIEARCPDGRTATAFSYGDFRPLRVGRDGRFAGSARQRDLSLDPFVRSITYSVRGNFSRSGNRVRGVLGAVVVGVDGMTCRSGRVTFRAINR